MNVQEPFYFKNFDGYVKNFKMFRLSKFQTLWVDSLNWIINETVNLSHKHISMTAQFLGLKAFILNFVPSQPPQILFFKNFCNL